VEAVVNSLIVVSTNVWYHVAGVRGPNFLQLYVNGQLQGTVTVNLAQNYGNFPLYLGTSGQAYWDGKLAGTLDEVSLYNRALSSNEIAAIYTAGAAGKCKGLNNSALASSIAQNVAVPPPVIDSVVLNDGVVVVTWSAVSGNTYRLQVTEDLESGNWNDVLPDVLAAGPTAKASDAVGNSARRFYRVLLVPSNLSPSADPALIVR
jgi:hypothetical protein